MNQTLSGMAVREDEKEMYKDALRQMMKASVRTDSAHEKAYRSYEQDGNVDVYIDFAKANWVDKGLEESDVADYFQAVLTLLHPALH
jgi:hypothetical protein